jgi:hypothetical protein
MIFRDIIAKAILRRLFFSIPYMKPAAIVAAHFLYLEGKRPGGNLSERVRLMRRWTRTVAAAVAASLTIAPLVGIRGTVQVEDSCR